jgi:hypothetical protein
VSGAHTTYPLCNTTHFVVPEYFPPARVETWLTLPPGVAPLRDSCEGEWCEGCAYRFCPGREPMWENWLGPTPPENKATIKRFIKEFGKLVAHHWGLACLLNEVMKAEWTSERMQNMFYAGSPFLDGLVGKTRKTPQP